MSTRAPRGGTIVVTGPTRGLGLATVRELAAHPSHPALLLLGRPGPALQDAAAQARAAGAAGAIPVTCDLADLDSVRAAAATVAGLCAGAVPPMSGIVANAGIQTTDLNHVTNDGLELTFGVNIVGTHLLLRLLTPDLAPGGRVILVGSGTADDRRGDRLVPRPVWEDPIDLARPGRAADSSSTRAGRLAYATSKLATIYLAHGWARHGRATMTVDVYDPGMMPGTGLVRDGSALERLGWRLIVPAARYVSWMSTPEKSGRTLARLALGEFGRNGDRYVAIDHDAELSPTAFNRQREDRLWEVADQLSSARTP
jgi:NAD(P)-dependent dehydrogenase (short-subunit alcohol dehydrogenase family)